MSGHAQSVSHGAPSPARRSLAIAIGGAAGGYLRVGLSLLPYAGSSGSWPWITFAVNLAGTCMLAFTLSLLQVRGRSESLYRPLIGAGFCGALTTFSTLQLEVFRMLRAGHWPLAGSYLAVSVLAGLLVALGGVSLATRTRSA